MAGDEEVARVKRLKRSCEVKRKSYVNKIRAVHSVAVRSAEDTSVVPQLLVMVESLDHLLSSFTIEDEALLNYLLDLELDNEYPDTEGVEMFELVSFSKATAHRFMQYCPDQITTSTHGGSQVSLNDVGPNVQKSDEQVITDNVTIDVSPGAVQLTNAGSVRSSGSQVIKPTRLPEIPLPTFEGDIYEWVTFRDRFTTSVDNRTYLSDIDKFYYLVGCCKGAARDAIRGIPVSDLNYRLAWSTLEERFDKPRLVARSLIEKLLNAPRAPSENLVELNKLLVVFDEGVSLLESLHLPNLGDFILFSIAARCLPTYSIKLFEAQLANGFPTVQELLKFVKSRVAILECIPPESTSKQSNYHKSTKTASHNARKPPLHTSMVTSNNPSKVSPSCKCCTGNHGLTSCPKFKGWTQENRNSWARDNKICFRCLRTGHWVTKCKSSNVCGQCSRRHHSLLHSAGPAAPSKEENSPDDKQPDVAHTSSCLGQNTSPSVILGTALIHMSDNVGVLHTVRALIDSASQISAITSECTNRLGLRMKKWTAPVSGIGGVQVQNVLGIVRCQVQPRFSPDPVFNFDAWVFPTITADIPRQPLSRSIANKYQHLALADPSFINPGTIDVLLGADLFAQILNGKRVSVGDAFPMAFGTVFGWTIIGPVSNSTSNTSVSCPISLTTSVEALLERFWALEEPDAAPEEFTQEGQCEAIFRDGCTRDSSGRFCVPLLFRQAVSGDTFRGSRAVAEKRFEHLEKKLANNPRLRRLYCDFMSEYLKLGHMSPAKSDGDYFIPHHAVYRPTDTNPKIRVVFDASATSYSGFSLNDCLLPGPKLQRDVVDVLLLYRVHRFAFTTDISKMYRQVSVSPSHRRYQHILWRSSPEQMLQAYELNTVTYGVNCAPYLAIKVLRSIAEQDCNDLPFIKEALLYQTYVDDICAGGDTLDEALSLQDGLIQVLHGAGMELKKWASNVPVLLDKIPSEDRTCEPLSLDDSAGTGTKVLGLQWSHQDDAFMYTFQPERHVSTKRGMLSLIARMFDPLGLLSPVTFFAKTLMQRVWKAGLSWDEQLPLDMAEVWRSFVVDLSNLQCVRIPRFLGTRRDMQCVICGFCDASSTGYAAVVYLRVIDSSGNPSVSLLGARSKIAPVKSTTIPRLELCAALLLARWLARITVTLSLKLHLTDVHAWSDSTTVLSWLKHPHESFKIFVSNRIYKIHSLVPKCQWHYIESASNPADCGSRGLTPSDFIQHDLYFNGPPCLSLPPQQWDQYIPINTADQLPEFKIESAKVLVTQEETVEWYERFSSYVQAVRTTARILRFIAQCRKQPVKNGYLSRTELDQAALRIARSSQRFHFSTLIHELSQGRAISMRLLARLRPFLDNENIVRVGGRLSRSDLSDDQKHPVLLSKTSHFSVLLIRHWHDITGHSGPQIVSSLVCRQYWILSVRTLIRTIISSCTTCVRITAKNPQPVMADLPSSRVTECHPFARVGVDYAGPFSVKENRLRKPRMYKMYLAVFVCFTVRAVHLEYVSDLSTGAFIAALHRFVARRGLPTDIYSDCGTNFVGANNSLRELVNDPACHDQLTASVHCTWHFNPPGAPHFGGLWEAAVRSSKSLLMRIMGEHTFTIEEFGTVLCRCEAILNSRPITPASSDPAELECLTPGHFLIGRPLLAVPEATIPSTTRSLEQRWKLVSQCVQTFWRRWRNEYLQTLQIRSRWTNDSPNISVDDMVVIKDPHTPPLKWRMGRVIEVLPGSDNVVRVVRLRTATGILTRPVVKVVKLINQP
ncbi:unnamed protein product [Macrosiphum euphorbiae]|uniref:Integrase catalytic domain-containing protein n=1 Tax=Macrosiphum euphorbiae TaxID=13131 RepID=A0AAV0XSW7_9HEMI|nr:unnamed protein product [Macrosiphum euphorbiae]